MMKVLAAVVIVTSAACGGVGDRPNFIPDPDMMHDTVAEVGRANETNPLLIYDTPVGIQLVDTTVVLYADNTGGSLTAVDLTTGRGWQITDQGEEGPGEFGGQVPVFNVSRGLIYTLLTSGQGSTRSLAGELLSSRQYRDPLFFVEGESRMPVGILATGVVVTYFYEDPDLGTWEDQTLTQGVKAFSPEGGLVWANTEVPPRVVAMEKRGGGSLGTNVKSGNGVVADARHSTVILGMDGEPWLLALNADGTYRSRVELPYDVFTAFIDADERVWVQVWAKNRLETGSYIVLDRELRTVAHVAERNIRDARGAYVVTIDADSLDIYHMYLLRRRGRRVSQ